MMKIFDGTSFGGDKKNFSVLNQILQITNIKFIDKVYRYTFEVPQKYIIPREPRNWILYTTFVHKIYIHIYEVYYMYIYFTGL